MLSRRAVHCIELAYAHRAREKVGHELVDRRLLVAQRRAEGKSAKVGELLPRDCALCAGAKGVSKILTVWRLGHNEGFSRPQALKGTRARGIDAKLLPGILLAVLL